MFPTPVKDVAERGPATVGEVARGFGEARGLARTTVLTVMERLRRKGYLGRAKDGGAYRYSTRVAPADSLVVNSSRGGGSKDTWILR